jgi:hypothetical protein
MNENQIFDLSSSSVACLFLLLHYLYNLLGEQVLKGTLNISNSEISFQDKSAGTYILRMINQDKIYTQKIIIE